MVGNDIPEWAEKVAQSLLQSLREKDPYTYGHCLRVARNARLLAQAAGLTEREQKIIEYSGMFHDLGKIGIPDSILLKEDQLTEKEEAIMRTHPVKSAEIISPLANIPFFRSTLPGVKHHHERIDGQGYPDGIQGDAIPLTARVILIADTFDAMTTNRPYRKALPTDFAYKELRQFSGRQFDSKLVKIFLDAHPQWGEHAEESSEERIRRAA